MKRPADWVRPAPFPWPETRTLEPGTNVTACYAVHEVDRGDGVLHLALGDARERVAAQAAEEADWIRPGIYVGVHGRVGPERTIQVTRVEPVRVTLEDLELFLPRSPRDAHEMEAELEAAIAAVMEPGLRALLKRLLAPDAEAGQGFRLAPAATRHHHAYLGGLLEHTLSVTAICRALAAHYGDRVDGDLLLTAALLHDIGKVREIGAEAGFPYTDEGRLLGHILLGLQMVHEASTGLPIPPDRVLLLEHLIASHQGRYEWQSPREPRTLEALLLHYADDLDAKVARATEALDRIEAGWTPWDRSLRSEWLRHRSPAPAPAADPPGPPPPRAPDPTREAPVARASRKGARRARKKPGRKPGPNAKPGKARPSSGRRSRGRARPPENDPKPGAERRPATGSRERDANGSGSPLPMDPDTIDLFE